MGRRNGNKLFSILSSLSSPKSISGEVLRNSTPSGVLLGEEIKKYDIIKDFDEDGCQLASYDLRLGSCHYVFDNIGKEDSNGWRLIHIGEDPEFEKLRKKASDPMYEKPSNSRNQLVIPPYGSAIIELKEIVDTYTVAINHNLLIVGRFDLKLSKVYQALISQQATQVEPLYKGRLYCFIHNLSSQEVSLSKHDKIATIEFSYAGTGLSEADRRRIIESKDKDLQEKYKQSSYGTEEERGIEEVRWFYANNRLPKDCGLNRFYRDIVTTVSKSENSIDMKFKNYVSQEETINQLSNSVSNRIQDKNKKLELIIAIITGVVTFGLGSLIWFFYQQLVQVIEHLKVVEDIIGAIAQGKPIETYAALSFEMGSIVVIGIVIIGLYVAFSIAILSIFNRRQNGSNEGSDTGGEKKQRRRKKHTQPN